MEKINWGIIGLGNIAQSFSEGFLNVKNARLLAISSSNSSKLEYFKNKYEINDNYIFKRYEDLLNCEDIDVVYIALPNNLHFEWIIKAIKSNKKILVEKPALTNLKNAKIVSDEVINKELFFTEGYMYRYNPQILKTIDIIKSQELGKVISMESFFCKNLLTKKKFIFFKKKKKIDQICLIRSQNQLGSFSFVIQDEPKGLGHAVWCARKLINNNENFVVILPDDIIL